MMTRYAFGRRGLELTELRHANDNGEAVDETKHNGMGDKTDKFAKPENASRYLQKAHQDNGGEEIFHAVIGDERHHDNGQSACCA